jgi:hypothetical protein
MRGDYYAYIDDGDEGEDTRMVLHSPYTESDSRSYVTAIPIDTFDELVVMRFAELLRDGTVHDCVQRIVDKGFGNWGTYAIAEHRPKRRTSIINQSCLLPQRKGRGAHEAYRRFEITER